MTKEQKCTYIYAMATCALIEAQGMVAENQQRVHRNESMAYGKDAFDALINQYGIHHNTVLGQFEE